MFAPPYQGSDRMSLKEMQDAKVGDPLTRCLPVLPGTSTPSMFPRAWYNFSPLDSYPPSTGRRPGGISPFFVGTHSISGVMGKRSYLP